MNGVVIHYKELALKGRNRPWFIRLLVRNVKTALEGLGVRSVRAIVGRIEVDFVRPADWHAVRQRLSHVFGIANFSLAGRGPLEFGALAAAILDSLGDRDAASFRVSARRADKNLPFTSPQLEAEVGGRVKDAKQWRVDLGAPALTVFVEAMSDQAFYYFGKERGAGGLPTGTSGRVACLLSGGIDSPVAAYRLMRRGCSVQLVHFHSYPILSRASQEKVREIAALLTRYQQRSRLYLVPFGELQQQVVLAVKPELRVVVYRRLMLRIAERLARKAGARALVTGDVIGQVASQTLDNMSRIGEAAGLQILRPLVGMDKDEIVDEAKAIGTYPISIIPDQDCCTLFTPKHPATHAARRDVADAEAALPVEQMVAAAEAAAIVETFRFPGEDRGNAVDT